MSWQAICETQEMKEMIGARALVGDEQVAVFKVKGKFYAVGAIDPFSHAAVLSRGIVGTLKEQVVVASPLFKQHFNLETGQCLEDHTVKIKTYAVRENAGKIELHA